MAHLLWLSPESQTSGFRVRNGGLREMPLSDGSMLVESSRTHLTTEWAGGIMVISLTPSPYLNQYHLLRR